jgi:hypothetical protein
VTTPKTSIKLSWRTSKAKTHANAQTNNLFYNYSSGWFFFDRTFQQNSEETPTNNIVSTFFPFSSPAIAKHRYFSQQRLQPTWLTYSVAVSQRAMWLHYGSHAAAL